MMRLARAASIGLAALAVATAGVAHADTKECSSAYVEAQKQRKAGALRKAREQLILCGKDSCLAAVKKDCVAWLDEVNASMPSVVVEAKGLDGRETLEVKVTVDGEVVAEQLGTGSIEVDPGVHRFRFEHRDQPPVEQEVIVREGQKHKPVEVSFAKSSPSAPPPAVTTTAAPSPDAPEPAPNRTLAYVLGGVGLVAIGAATALWISAESSRGTLEDSGCSPRCAEGDVDSIRTRRIIGDVALGVGVAAVAVGVYFFLKPPGASNKAAVTLPLGPRATPGFAARF